MSKIEKVVIAGKTHTTMSANTKGTINLELSTVGNARTNHLFSAIQPHPTAEQFFAGAWSSCYIIALGVAAQEVGVTLPPDLSVDIEVDLGTTGNDWYIQARFNVVMKGVEQEVAEAIAHKADQICPYSKAVRGNIDVAMNVATA
ncbi:OsmC family protein [Pseudomonas sp. NPDC088444]|uniref:OsmC family protein n=1 Tax=Pseudomonas sp. NPDC088444 TaxID=3364456 RepID=UPI003850CA7D